MKNRKIIIPTIIVVVLLIIGFCAYKTFANKNRDIGSLLYQLSESVNTKDKELLVQCFPDFMQEEVVGLISEDEMNDFYNNVITDENKMKISGYKISSYDLSEAKNVQRDIESQYNVSVSVKDYQILQCVYMDGFDQTNLQVIKIGSKYYLYANSYYPEPISYFIN